MLERNHVAAIFVQRTLWLNWNLLRAVFVYKRAPCRFHRSGDNNNKSLSVSGPSQCVSHVVPFHFEISLDFHENLLQFIFEALASQIHRTTVCFLWHCWQANESICSRRNQSEVNIWTASKTDSKSSRGTGARWSMRFQFTHVECRCGSKCNKHNIWMFHARIDAIFCLLYSESKKKWRWMRASKVLPTRWMAPQEEVKRRLCNDNWQPSATIWKPKHGIGDCRVRTIRKLNRDAHDLALLFAGRNKHQLLLWSTITTSLKSC